MSSPQPRLGAYEGKNNLNSDSQQRGDQAGRAADFIDSIDPKSDILQVGGGAPPP